MMSKTLEVIMKFAAPLIFLLVFLFACSRPENKPNDFPTPPPSPAAVPAATPLAKIALKPDGELEKQIAEISKDAKGKVGVAAVLLETGDSASLNADQHFPMQSVYKLPISMAMMDQIKNGKHSLDEKITVTKDDYVREGQRSPLRDENPNGGEFTIRELIRFALVESDGSASDVLIRVAGGANEIQSYLTRIGLTDIKVVNTEKEIGRDWETQYRNWATPTAAVDLLTGMRTWSAGGDEKELILHRFMFDSTPGANRIKGLLPKGTNVAHKTGTSGTENGITAATNDIGVIWLPNGRHIAIAVFVSDSPADEKTREAVIADIAKAVWDRWNK